MPTLFTRIIDGELPARFVWQDDHTVAFLDLRPFSAGHTLVVPRREVEQWTDAEPDLMDTVFRVAHIIGQAQQKAFAAPRVGLLLAGFDVPHLHVHVFPAESMQTFAALPAGGQASPAELDEAAGRLRTALRDLGHAAYVPED